MKYYIARTMNTFSLNIDETDHILEIIGEFSNFDDALDYITMMNQSGCSPWHFIVESVKTL